MTEEVKQKDREISKNIKDSIKNMDGDNVDTKSLARQMHQDGLGGRHYIKQRLHTSREWIVENSDVESFVKNDNTGGNDTRYWKVEE